AMFGTASINHPIWLAETLGLSGSVLAYLSGELLYVGIASGARKGDMDREWLARSSGWLMATAVSWALFCPISLYAPRALRDAVLDTMSRIGVLFAGGVSGFVTLVLGWSGKTGATKAAQSLKSLSLMRIASGAAVIFALLIGAVLASLVELLEC